MTLRQEKLNTFFTKLLARYVRDIAPRGAVITITHCDVSKDLRSAHAYLSVFPETYEQETLAIIDKSERDIDAFLRANTKMKILPKIRFEIDKGEKNRQRIEELLRKK